MANGKMPWFPFYPSDWLYDANLSLCSLAAQGLWIRILCRMHDCEQRGVLSKNGKPWTEDDVLVSLGHGEEDKECRASLIELIENGVIRKLPDGTMYSRRMVRDDHEREMSNERSRRFRERQDDATLMQRRCNGDATMQRRCNDDATLMQRRCNGDATMQRRCNAAEVRSQKSEVIENIQEGNGTEGLVPQFKFLTTRYRKIVQDSCSHSRKNQEAYQQACQKYGEDRVLAYFEEWAPKRAEWLKSQRDGLWHFWKALPSMVDGDAMRESESVTEAGPPALTVKNLRLDEL